MVEAEREEFCAFHYTNTSDGKCSTCGLTICNLDQHYGASADRICQLCFNITKARKIVRYVQIGIWVVIIALVIVLWQVLAEGNFIYALLPVILILFVPYILRPLVFRLYFTDLLPKESILPILRYFEASGNNEHYKIFIKLLKKISDEDLEEIRPVLYTYLIPALAFNFSKLPDEWEEEMITNLKVSKEEFVQVFTKDYREILIKTSVHNAQENLSQFLIYLSKTADDQDLLKEYITEMTSDEIMNLNENDLNAIYGKLLEDVFLFEEQFYEICDELNLEKEKILLTQLLSRYEPPPVPKNQIEAVMTPTQLREKRKKEKEAALLQKETQNLTQDDSDLQLALDESEEKEKQ
ncbi:MAG: hypothetical protein ACFFDS_09180 [Candidatus Thorarchaeota archaeon]